MSSKWLRRVGRYAYLVLRFCNLIEPDLKYPVLSISKAGMWGTYALTFYICLTQPTSLEMAFGGLMSLASTGNYAYRRHVQFRSGRGAYALGMAEPELPEVVGQMPDLPGNGPGGELTP